MMIAQLYREQQSISQPPRFSTILSLISGAWLQIVD